MTTQPLFAEYKLKTLPGSAELVPDAVYWIKDDAETSVRVFVTDRNGVASPIAYTTDSIVITAADVSMAPSGAFVTLVGGLGLNPSVARSASAVTITL